MTYREDVSCFGEVSVTAADRVNNFAEKGRAKSGLINAGVYWMSPELLDWVPERVPSWLERDVLPKAISAGRLYGVRVDGYFVDIGTPASLVALHRRLLKRRVSVAAVA